MRAKRTYRYRLYPSKKTEKEMEKTLEMCRQTYNELLSISIETHKNIGKGLTRFDLNKCIKYGVDADIRQVHSHVLQNVSDRISKAYSNFFRRVKEKREGKNISVGFPRFKKSYKSFTYPQNGFKMEGNKLILSKIGKTNVRIGKKQNRIRGKIKTLTIKRQPSGKWFAIFSCEIDIDVKRHKNSHKSIGIDVGLKKFAVLSDGTEIGNPRHLINSEKKLKRLHRRLSRKKKGSNGRKRAKIRLARLYEHIHNQRHNFTHQFSKMLVDQYGSISVEDLNIKNMVKHPYLAKHINDASWRSFRQKLDYKAESAGSQVTKVNPRGTTQKCSQCGHKVPKTLATRWHRCPICGLEIDRDLNSAIIIEQITVGTTGNYADGDGSSPLGSALEVSPSRKSEATQLVGW